MAIPTGYRHRYSTSMYNLADTYFVGQHQYPERRRGSVSFAVMSVIQAVGFLYGQWLPANYVSRMLGAKEVEKAKKMAAHGLRAELS